MLSMHTRQRASQDYAESLYLGLQVGALSGGLAGALWSPDGNLLCLVSVQGQLLLMNKVSIPHASAFLALHSAVGQGTGCHGVTCCVFTQLQEHASIIRALVA